MSPKENTTPPVQPGRPSQYKKHSRKGKKAWRKNVDINDVEQGQEQLRVEEMSGGRIEERADDDLFQVDTQGDVQVRREVGMQLKTYEVLHKRSKVAIPPTMKASSRKADSKVSKNEQERIDRIAEGLKRKVPGSVNQKATASQSVKVDLWGEGTAQATDVKNTIPASVKRADYIEEVVVKRAVRMPKSIGSAPKMAPDAVQPAHPGASYLPTPEAREELMAQAAAQDRERREKAEEIQRRSKVSERVKHMDGRDLIEDEEEEKEEEEEEEENEEEGETVIKATSGGDMRKSKRIRAKEAAQREREKAEQERKRQRQLANDAAKAKDNAKLAQKEQRRKEKEAEERRLRREAAKELPRKKLGKYRVPEAHIHVSTDQDQADSLRLLKPQGNVLAERFHSLQERNIVEPRLPAQKRRRYERKTYEKPTYKNFS